MGIINLFRKKYYEPEVERKIINIDGFEIDDETKELLSAQRGLEVYNIPKEVMKISDYALRTMESAVEINFHKDSKITEFPYQFFQYQYYLRKLTLPNGLKRLNEIVGYHQFAKGLVYNIPDSLEEISSYEIPPSLERVVLSNKLKRVGLYLAMHTTELKYLEVPGSLEDKTVPKFSNAQSIETLVLHEGLEKMSNTTLYGLNSLVDIYVPDSLKTFYLGEDDPRNISAPDGTIKNFYTENRNIRIHKTFEDGQVIFEFERKEFSSFSVSEEYVYFNYCNLCIKMPMSELEMNSYYKVNKKTNKIEKVCSLLPNNEQYEIKSKKRTK